MRMAVGAFAIGIMTILVAIIISLAANALEWPRVAMGAFWMAVVGLTLGGIGWLFALAGIVFRLLSKSGAL